MKTSEKQEGYQKQNLTKKKKKLIKMLKIMRELRDFKI
jgi:hypothetical protein